MSIYDDAFFLQPQNDWEQQQNNQFFAQYDNAFPKGNNSRLFDFHHPNDKVQVAAKNLVAQARSLEDNDAVADGVLSHLIALIIGKGLLVEPMVKFSTGQLHIEFNQKIKQQYSIWSKHPFLDGTEGSIGERLICRTLFRDGELFLWLRRGPEFPHLTEMPFSLQMLEADAVPIHDTHEEQNIIQGIQFNLFGFPVSYHVLRDLKEYYSVDTINVPARDIIHAKLVKRFNQVRGVTPFHSVLNIFQDAKDAARYELMASKLAATIGFQIVRDVDMPTPEDLTKTGLGRKYKASPMSVYDQNLPGEKVEIINPNGRPNTQLPEFNNTQYRIASRPLGVSFDTMMGIVESSYSAGRQIRLIEAMNIAVRASDFIENVSRLVYQEFLKSAVLYGFIKLPNDIDKSSLFTVDFKSPVMDNIDPLKSMNADIAAIQQGILSLSEVQRRRGYNPDEMQAEIRRDKAFLEEVGAKDASNGVEPMEDE
jgi:lambda family phage portal protein